MPVDISVLLLGDNHRFPELDPIAELHPENRKAYPLKGRLHTDKLLHTSLRRPLYPMESDGSFVPHGCPCFTFSATLKLQLLFSNSTFGRFDCSGTIPPGQAF